MESAPVYLLFCTKLLLYLSHSSAIFYAQIASPQPFLTVCLCLCLCLPLSLTLSVTLTLSLFYIFSILHVPNFSDIFLFYIPVGYCVFFLVEHVFPFLQCPGGSEGVVGSPKKWESRKNRRLRKVKKLWNL